jgi:hypothetical protein
MERYRIDTLTGTGPTADATNVSVGDRLLLDDNTILTVTATNPAATPDTITVDTAVTISGDILYKITAVDIARADWIDGPDMRDEPVTEAPDVVQVNYTNAETLTKDFVRCEDPDGYTAAAMKKTEVTLSGCPTASAASRVGHQIRRVQKLCPFSWTGVASPNAAGLEPGDVITFSSRTLSDQLAIVISAECHPGNMWALTLREFDMGVYADDTADDDTLPTVTKIQWRPPRPQALPRSSFIPAISSRTTRPEIWMI